MASYFMCYNQDLTELLNVQIDCSMGGMVLVAILLHLEINLCLHNWSDSKPINQAASQCR